MPRSIPTLCGSLTGEPFALGVRIHNASYRALGLDYTFVCFGVEDPAAAVAAIRTLGIRGSNVSMPYKSAVMPHLDAIDPAARAIGAVNTIDNRDGHLTGYNSDYVGALRALQEVCDCRGRRLAVLGAGGAARAVVYGAREAGAAVTVFNRSAARGQALADEMGAAFGGPLEAFRAEDFAIVVNATSVGFRAPDLNPLAGRLAPHLVVMDVAFIPARTRLIRDAEALGCRTVPGTRMFLHQSCRQIELYTGCEAPLAVMEAALLDAIAQLEAA
ncbi:shikimate dehydrogenase [Plasticicumulans lactativorans]|uniref:Shikimate dehydrogenase n=1 Tax=Plasticicumulans lactativorans TaxID=1133106 RepID=A0A4R2L5F8_9GAMM|nr:shikimate dehydrogenase [Plasticicumulans lactativorans]TCO82614.1 shikimate dehydrogenase [Plasticicumulans lactativorans]